MNVYVLCFTQKFKDGGMPRVAPPSTRYSNLIYYLSFVSMSLLVAIGLIFMLCELSV